MSEQAETPSVPTVTAGTTPRRRNRRLSNSEELPIRSYPQVGNYAVLGEYCRPSACDRIPPMGGRIEPARHVLTATVAPRPPGQPSSAQIPPNVTTLVISSRPSEPSHRALRLLRREDSRWRNVEVRTCKYLNNIVEQDHRAIKRRCASMAGFKSFDNAAITIAGIEPAHRINKRQSQPASADRAASGR